MATRRAIFLVDDDAFSLMAWKGILHATPYYVEAYQTPHALLARVTPSDRGCVVVDLRMPGMSGLELQRALQERGVALPLIFVSGGADVPAAVRAMKQGAIDFLCKPVLSDDLLAAIERAMHRDEKNAADRDAREAALARWRELTPREQSLCGLVSRGLLNKQIAAELGVAESTVQAQRTRLLKKLAVASVAELLELIAKVRQEPA